MPIIYDALTCQKLDPENAIYLNFSTKKGNVRLRVNIDTAKELATKNLKSFTFKDKDFYKKNSFWGSYYNEGSIGRITGEYVWEIIENPSIINELESLALNVFFDDKLNQHNTPNNEVLDCADERCDCNCNCNCNCEDDCNCDCNCDCDCDCND